MKIKNYLFVCMLLSVLGSCKHSDNEGHDNVDAIYYNGDIITMEGDSAIYADAVAVKDGKIVFVGSKEYAFKLNGADAEGVKKDLEGKTLLPGFIDGHSHFSDVGTQTACADLLPYGVNKVRSIVGIQKVLKGYLDTSSIAAKYHIVIGMNYDNSQLTKGKRAGQNPIRQDLDIISSDTSLPVIIIHQSGHLAVFNTKALKLAGITASTPNPAGGVIVRESDNKTPNGQLQEVAFFRALDKIMPKFKLEDVKQMLLASQGIYISNGFTTVQDGKTSQPMVEVLSLFAKEKIFKVDIVSYPDLVAVEPKVLDVFSAGFKTYSDHLKMGGVKLTLDGSPQGKTAWFSKPYYVSPNGDKKYHGYPAFKDDTLYKWLRVAYDHKWQLLTHTNGDSAITQLINAAQHAQDFYASEHKDYWIVMIHGQFLQKDQVKRIKELKIFPSLYPLHSYYWGDYHRTSVVGPERAKNLSPTGWLLENRMIFSIHSDAPVIFPNSMEILSSAVNRTTLTDTILGREHRLTAYTALKAMTTWPAYQYFEENNKGTLTVGKAADFVILDKNPLKVAPAPLKPYTQPNISVMETIKDGKSIYKKE